MRGDCFVNETWRPNGSSWTEACNTCWCKDTKVECTRLACGGAGGTAGTGGASAGQSGGGGQAGEPVCEDAPIGAFCVVGIPLDSGDQVSVGMPLQLRLFPSGCHSSSCTIVESASCSYLASGQAIWVTPFVCLRQEGDACTDDCGGGATSCDVGLELEAGTTSVYIPGTALSVTFDVPSVSTGNELCTGEI